MSVIYVLLSISLVVAVIFFAAFIVSVKSGQYDDTYTPSVRILFEDELVKTSPILKGRNTKSLKKLEIKKKSIKLKKRREHMG
ncbi:MAG: cbb3-type cytochrome oxidase assembly protein CcoS [Maribacter sp.]|nr:cbb3-type cytochrome oxidase assembly protein CcoS [Maribacter sp.]